MHDPRPVALKENLPAMKDTAGSGGSLLIKSPVRAGFAMNKGDIDRIREEHVNCVLEINGDQFQALCSCGWSSTIHFLEHVDLLRAMHAHAVVTFEVYV